MIDIVKLFPELDNSILYTQLATVKEMIDKDCKGLAHDINEPQRHPVVRMLSLNWRLWFVCC